ncbi:spexin prohormone 2 [Labeo rohita]|uniref:spexin prohormone 2 n=1 Tax=Labeo rohita TaxID=84645 RepID=UPI0021E1EC02|nr:spexin prohormone 2 [Labeo rohita]XP_050955813.1 spexin prohormone 2 [Labeo rohita]XP_050955814.1 spexin prohormone 2 [Labeo rohita]
MNESEDQEYSYRRDSSEGSVVPLHDTHGSPRMANLISHGMHSEPGYSRMEEPLREGDYTTYRILHPLTCDPLPPVAHFSSASYPEYLLAQSSHYQHVIGQPYSAWPSQEAFHYGMSSGDFCRAATSMSSEGADVYSLEGYSTHQGFRHHDGDLPHALLVSSHDQKLPAETTSICQMLQPVQVVCDVTGGGQVIVLNQSSPDQIPHSLMTVVNTESLPKQSDQSCSTEDHSPTGEASDARHSGKIVSTELPQIHKTSAGVTFNLTPGPYASQLHQELCPTQVVKQDEEEGQTKGRRRVKWEKSKRPCNCTKSQCLKLYCECFANGDVCNNCKCLNCFNNTEHDLERSEAIKTCLDRNPGAFRPKIGSRKQGNVRGCHTKGCNCKRSGCLKNYCECYEAKIMCTSTCKCVGCRNYEESPTKKSSEQDRPDPSIYYPTRSPLACITPDVVEATCGCLLAQAEEAEKEGYTSAHAERMILEEFGQCLTQIVRSMFKSTSVQFNE